MDRTVLYQPASRDPTRTTLVRSVPPSHPPDRFSAPLRLNPILPKTCVISIKELSKDLDSIEPLIQRGLVQSLGRLTDTNDPTLQINLLIAFTNLARKRVAKDQIARLPQWPNIVHFADSFDPGVSSPSHPRMLASSHITAHITSQYTAHITSSLRNTLHTSLSQAVLTRMDLWCVGSWVSGLFIDFKTTTMCPHSPCSLTVILFGP